MPAASRHSRSRIGTSPSLLGVYSLVPALPLVTRQKTTVRPSRAHRATLPATVNSLSSGCAEMHSTLRSEASSEWGCRGCFGLDGIGSLPVTIEHSRYLRNGQGARPRVDRAAMTWSGAAMVG